MILYVIRYLMGKNRGFRDRDLTIFPSGFEKLFDFRNN
jgi:hypothetical protein